MSKYLLFIGGNDIDYYYEVENFLNNGAGNAKELFKRVGGCIYNTAKVASKLGSDVKILDYLKEDDDESDELINSLKKYDVDTKHIQYAKDVKNGKCLILKKKQEKCIYVIEPTRPFHIINDSLKDLLFNATYIYSLMHTIKLSFKDYDVLKEAKKKGVKIIFDGSSQYNEKYEIDMLLDLADGLFINKDSYELLNSHFDFEIKDYLIDKGIEFICITDGSKGVNCYTKDKNLYEKAVFVDVVDSTGAGDSFAGCFLHFRSKGYALEECLKLANLNGSYACLKMGGDAGAISEEELFNYANELK